MRSLPSAQTIIGTGLLSNSSRNEASRCFNSVISTRWLPESLAPGFAGRPNARTIAVCLDFLFFLGLVFDILTPCPCSPRALFSDKCLKEWYQFADESGRIRFAVA